ncbi:MAG: polymer-forming cytoskeletal protein [Bacteroidia bacterium]
MFSKNNNSKSADSTSVNLIATGTTITGDVKTEGDFRIDGTLQGTLTVKGKLVVGSNGLIKGEIECQNADVSGEVNGKINVNELLALRATAKINGDIFTGKISIEPDAQFTGNCSMGGVVKNIKNASANEQASRKTAVAAN